jgi:hypothetical protein
MKKSFLIIAAAFGLMSGIQAQATFGLGARLGFGVGFYSGVTTFINAALITDVRLSKFFAIQPELQFISKRFPLEYTSGFAIGNLNFIGLTILPKIYFEEEISEFFVMAGPSVNVKTLADQSIGRQITELTGIPDFNISAVIGGGIGFKITKKDKIITEVRYNLGLLKVSDYAKLNQLAFNLGYIRTFGGSK